MKGIVRAAGGIVWRPGAEGEKEILLVHRPAYDDWSFPKGKLAPGESEADAALREVWEEAGIQCRLGRDVGTISYTDSKGRPKTVRYWEMTPEPGAEPEPGNEVDDVSWVPVPECAGRLSYEHDRGLLGRLEASA